MKVSNNKNSLSYLRKKKVWRAAIEPVHGPKEGERERGSARRCRETNGRDRPNSESRITNWKNNGQTTAVMCNILGNSEVGALHLCSCHLQGDHCGMTLCFVNFELVCSSVNSAWAVNNWVDVTGQMRELVELPNGSQQSLVSNHHGQWVTLYVIEIPMD